MFAVEDADGTKWALKLLDPTRATQLYAKPSLNMLREAIESVETPEQKAEKPIWEEGKAMMAKPSGLM